MYLTHGNSKVLVNFHDERGGSDGLFTTYLDLACSTKFLSVGRSGGPEERADILRIRTRVHNVSMISLPPSWAWYTSHLSRLLKLGGPSLGSAPPLSSLGSAPPLSSSGSGPPLSSSGSAPPLSSSPLLDGPLGISASTREHLRDFVSEYGLEGRLELEEEGPKKLVLLETGAEVERSDWWSWKEVKINQKTLLEHSQSC
jgi:hypothetical protein